MSERESLDRIETNFRLSLISQRETNVELRRLAKKVTDLAKSVTEGLSEVADGLTAVAEKGEQTAERLEDSIEVMKSFAESQVEIRKTLADHGQRLDALEKKQAS
ncbi:MAG: hypothetical protein HY319_14175 [Armatimonadetes bacterium]|nr:hypothetical protein [Armatimonadota bacterium]